MRKGQDIKLNVAGQVGCLLLVLLLWMAICPVAGSSAFAEETTDENYDVATAADANVTISFTPMSGSVSLTPTTSDGASAKIDVVANVKIASTGGYSIYLGGQNAALTGASKGATIPGATTARTFNELETNTWGYAYAEGTTVPDAATYSALPQGQGKILESVSGNNTNIDKTYALSFATKIGNDKPADVYENQITLSVTSSPMEVVGLTSIATMQEMTTTVCDSSEVGDTIQLEDMRDGKYYWVTKLKDNKCWMTQNLDLDLSTSKALTPSDSDVSSDWTPEYDTATAANYSTILANDTGQRSWSLGNYRITNPEAANGCGAKKNGISQCSSQFTAYNTPVTDNTENDAHYIVGNHYQWNAATAGSGAKTAGSYANNSICPKGWKLPETNSNVAGSFSVLLNLYNITNSETSMASLISEPLYFVRGGYVGQSTSYLFNNAGNYGYYWSSSLLSNNTNAYMLSFNGTNSIGASNDYARRGGFSVRCVAR